MSQEIMEEYNMNAVQTKKRREIIEERFMKIHEEVFRKLMNEEKNSYDMEITLPMCEMEDISTKKNYNIGNRDNDTPARKKRRENHMSKLEKYIIKGNNKEAEIIIKQSYYASITDVSQKADHICNEKTARKLIKSMFKIIGYSNIDKIPKVLINDVIQHIEKIILHSKTIYKCCRKTDKILSYMDEEEMIYTYEFYLLAKKIILIDSYDKAEYEERLKSLHKNKKVKAVYAAVREII